MTTFDRTAVGDRLRASRVDQHVADVPEDAREGLLLDLTHALHRFGLPGHRLETGFRELSDALTTQAMVLAMPTFLLFSFGEGLRQRVALLRVQPSSIDLGRLADLDRLTRELIADHDVAAARRRLETILDRPRRWAWPVDLFAGAVASASAAALFHGAMPEDLAVSAGIGATVAALALLGERFRWLSVAWVVIAAFVSGLAANAAAGIWDVHAGRVAVAGIILLVPGLSFTISMMELATQNLASGVSRFAAAGVTLVQLGLGMAAARHLLPAGPEPLDGALPAWATGVALVLLPTAIGQLMGARARDLPVIAGAAWVGWVAAQGGEWLLGATVGAACGTFGLGLAAHVYRRVADAPAIIPMVTGLFLLVPGVLGFRGVDAMLSGQTVEGIEALFRMGVGAFALAAGFVVATAVAVPRRADG